MTLHYSFPNDITLSEVKEIVRKNENFYIGERDGYLVVNYLVAGSDTHPPVVDRETAIMRELRGMIFDYEGRILARRLHKFFNLGERQDITNIDISKHHVVLEKLDGSMITPFIVNGELRWGTKMGLTDVSIPVEDFVNNSTIQYKRFALNLIEQNCTPIFEWCSRKQRIVIDYPEDRLVLLAIRENDTGNYVQFDRLISDLGIPEVSVMEPISNLERFIVELKKREDIEGVVIRFDDGHMVKIKTDTYVALHRAKSEIESERHVVGLILENKIDDLIALLPEDDKTRLLDYQDQVNRNIGAFCTHVDTILYQMSRDLVTRKDFALNNFKNANEVSASMRTFIFKHWEESDLVHERGYSNVRESVHEFILKHLGSNKSFEKVIPIIQVRWKEIIINDA